ncbi:MAG: hypothetical protein HYY93_09545 [Planctomycetes bacterium]|nr:hypothetical protein [Planctomycetota bacterium]
MRPRPLSFLLVLAALLPAGPTARAVPFDAQAWADADKANEKTARRLVSEFEAAWRNTHEPTRLKAIESVSTLNHPLIVRALGITLTQGGEALRIAGAGAMGRMNHRPEAARLLAAAVKPNAKMTNVLVALYAAMGAVGDPSSIAVLNSELSSRLSKARAADLPIVQACVEALGKIHDKRAVDALIDVWQKADPDSRPTDKTPRETADFREAVNADFGTVLSTLTGERERPWSEWKSWWKKAKNTFTLPEGPDAPPPENPDGADTTGLKPPDDDKAGEGEGDKPKEGEGDKPAAGEGDKPKEGEGEKPPEGGGDKPKEGEGAKPAEGEGGGAGVEQGGSDGPK